MSRSLALAAVLAAALLLPELGADDDKATKPPSFGPEPKPGAKQDPNDEQEPPLVQMLRGLLAQKERRIAGLLKEVGAAREAEEKERLVFARVTQDLTLAKKRVAELEREVALARAGVTPPSGATPPAGSPLPGAARLDERFAPGGALDPSAIVARVNDEPVAMGELLAQLVYNYGVDYFDPFLRLRIAEQEAARLSVHIDDTECLIWAAKQVAELSAQAGGDDSFRRKLREQGKTPENYEAALRRAAPFALRVERIIAIRRRGPEGLARLERLAQAEYERQFGPAVKGAHIFWRVAADAPQARWDAAWRLAEAAHDGIIQGKQTFEEAARRESQDEETKERGGHFGPIDKNKYKDLPAFNTAIFSLRPGAMQVLRSNQGVHVLKVIERVPPALTWEQARPKLLRDLEGQGPTREEADALLEELWLKARVDRFLKLR